MDWFQKIWNGLIEGLPYIKRHENITDQLPEMATLSLLVGLGVALLILLLLSLLNRYRHGRWNISGKLLTTLFGFSWLLGFVVYAKLVLFNA